MKEHRKFIAVIAILLISTLACSLTGSADPVSAIQTLIPAEAQTLVASVVAPAATDLAGGGSASSSNGDCGNPLYPAVAGATWSYAMSGVLPDTFTRTIPASSTDGFTDQDVFTSGVTRTGKWTCEFGALTALNASNPGAGVSASIQATDLTGDFETTNIDGVTLPAVVTSGTSWSQSITLEGIQNIAGETVPSKSTSNQNCTAAGNESVTVPAGTFNAMRVECQLNLKISITMMGVEIPTEMSFSTTTWYAAGVGMVKTDTLLSDSTTTIMELTAYNIP